MKKQIQIKTQQTVRNQNDQVLFAKPFKVKKSSNGNLLVFIAPRLCISLHPNYIKAILEATNPKKAR